MKYYSKVWFFTVIASPLMVLLSLTYLNDGKLVNPAATSMIWLIAVGFGILLSLPALFLFRLFYNDVTELQIAKWLKRGLHALTGVILKGSLFIS